MIISFPTINATSRALILRSDLVLRYRQQDDYTSLSRVSLKSRQIDLFSGRQGPISTSSISSRLTLYVTDRVSIIRCSTRYCNSAVTSIQTLSRPSSFKITASSVKQSFLTFAADAMRVYLSGFGLLRVGRHPFIETFTDLIWGRSPTMSVHIRLRWSDWSTMPPEDA